MNRKTVSGIMVTLLVVSLFTLAFSIQPALASGTIYIRPDGSINPPTAPIIRDGDLYTLTDNINNSIIVQKENIVIDGAGYTLQGTGDYTGIRLFHGVNVTIKNVEIKAFRWGITILGMGATNNTIFGNNITDNGFSGIKLGVSDNNHIFGNNITNNGEGIYLSPLGLPTGSVDNHISGNNIKDNFWGISLYKASNNHISENNIIDNTYGIRLRLSASNHIFGNNITNNEFGIRLSSSNHNSISGNDITDNFTGIQFLYSSSNTGFRNSITDNIMYGIDLHNSLDNEFYHNNFINNTVQVYDFSWDNPIPPSVNMWDNGYPSGGNYWSDFKEEYPNATEIDNSGIWDTPYEIDENNQDNYPLIEPWTPLPRTISELTAEIEELSSEGEIDNQGIVRSLIAKLNVAQKLIEDGRIDQAMNILNAFISEVQAQSGKHITPEAADILIESAEYILSHL